MARMTYDEAAHLLRRMGFGGTPAEIDSLATRSRDEAVDYLLNYEAVNNDEMDNYLSRNFNPKRFTPTDDLQLWWIVRMLKTARPFEEKMTIFWHNHFATALDKVDYPLMYLQNQLLRSNALERFDSLLLNVARDPAMLVWLDGVSNVRGNPNENFARELQELFTMGIYDAVTGQANYTEKDVKEIARAFTGWTFKQKGEKKYKYVFYIQADHHDDGAKEIYGRVANYSGEDVIEVVCARRSTARFLIKKLFEFFVYPLSNSGEDKATIEKFADVYVNGNHSLRAVVRAIFTSEEFFGTLARFALIKSPAEMIVSSIRTLGADYYAGNMNDGDYDTYGQFRRMGFDLLNPRDVSGWKLNLGWLSTATLLERYNFASDLLTNRDFGNRVLGAKLTNDQLRKYTDASAEKTVQNFLALLGPLKVDAATVQTLANYLQMDDDGRRVNFTVDDHSIDKTVRGLVYLIMCLPEYQMN
ncbi:MAG: DUF1800 domain-containing protein [Acidobacteria bacterium]|nr:DUF1800 domain-containing protein [Acidobacteriota bacterium]